MAVYADYTRDTDLYPHWDTTAYTIEAHSVYSNANLTQSSAIIASVDDVGKLTNSNNPLIKIHPTWAKRVVSLNTADDVPTAILNMDQILTLALSDIGPTYDPGNFPDSIDFPTFFQPKHLASESQLFPHLTKDENKSTVSFLHTKGSLRNYASISVWAHDNWTDPSSLTEFDVQNFLQGYGYDSSGTTVRLSLVLLATYAFIVIIHLSYTSITGQAGTSWDSIGELVMLAFNSRQPVQLHGTSVGVETTSTYGEVINIRINKASTAEIVFHNDPDLEKNAYSPVHANKKYS